ncbi:MAG: NB-ARC domain-containing protein [Cyanobacteria bacterium J06635_15]
MARSLRIDKEQIQRAKLALKRSGFSSQRALATELGLALSTVSRFFTSKPVDYTTFVDVCDRIGLDWQECAAVKPPSQPPPPPSQETPTASEALPPAVPTVCDWGGAVEVSVFFGRESELAILQQWVVDDCCRLLLVLGMGGMGKTVLAIKLAQQVQSEFDYIIWRSLRNAPPILELLSDLIGVLSQQQVRDVPVTVDQGIARLLTYLRQSRCLLILDNGEALLQSGDRSGRYRAGYEGYGQLLRAIGESDHTSSLVLTSREQPRSFTAKQGQGLPIRSLKLGGLSVGDSQHLCANKGQFTGSKVEWADLVQRYAGNPLALTIVAAFVSEFFEGSLTQFLAFVGRSPFVFDDIQDLLDQQMQRLSELEQETMYWLAINREPVSRSDLQTDFLMPISTAELLQVLASLQNRSLIERSQDGFTQQPVVMEYMTNQLTQQVRDELLRQQPDCFRRYALIKAQAQDYVRDTQIRLILQPVIDELTANLGSPAQIETQLKPLLAELRGRSPQETGYVAGNIINLLGHLGVDLSGYDFSHLTVWQADLQRMTLQDVNFARADLSRSRFMQVFGGISSVTFSPDGNYLAGGNSNNSVLLWEAASGQLLSTYNDHTDWAYSVDFSPDGRLLASGSFDQTVRVWDLIHGTCLHSLIGHTTAIWTIAFSPDGRLIASGSADGNICLWDVQNGTCLHTLQGHSNLIRSISFALQAYNPDRANNGQDAILASASLDGTVKLWQAYTGQCLRILAEHTDAVCVTAFSPNGKWLATGSNDCTIKVWNWEDGRCLKTLSEHNSPVWACAFSPDGQMLAGGSLDGILWLWQAHSGKCLYRLTAHTNLILDVDFSPDSAMLVSGSLDGTVKLWSTENGRRLKTLSGYANTIWTLAYNPQGNVLVSGSQDGVVRLWDCQNHHWSSELKHQGTVLSIAINTDGRLLVSGSNHLEMPLSLWDLTRGQRLQQLSPVTSTVRAVALSPKDNCLASGNDDYTVGLWDISRGQCIQTLQGHTNVIWCVDFSRNGQLLASGSLDHTLRIWDVETGRCLHTLHGHRSEVGSVTFSPDGHLLVSGGSDSVAMLWDVREGECISTLTGHTAAVASVAFNKAGTVLMTASLDQTIRLWNLNTKQCFKIFQGHTRGIWAATFSPDNRFLASGGDDETIRLWDVETGKCLETIPLPKPYEGMNITDVQGITAAEVATLKALGAIESGLL